MTLTFKITYTNDDDDGDYDVSDPNVNQKYIYYF